MDFPHSKVTIGFCHNSFSTILVVIVMLICKILTNFSFCSLKQNKKISDLHLKEAYESELNRINFFIFYLDNHPYIPQL